MTVTKAKTSPVATSMRVENIVGRLFRIETMPDDIGGPLLFRVIIISGAGVAVGREEGENSICPHPPCAGAECISHSKQDHGYVWICTACKGQIRRCEFPLKFLWRALNTGEIEDRGGTPDCDLRYFYEKARPKIFPSLTSLN